MSIHRDFQPHLDRLADSTASLCQLWAMNHIAKQLRAGLDMDVEAAMDDARVIVAEYLEGLARTLRKEKGVRHADQPG